MTRVIEKTVYKFEELSERAKEKAREWYREAGAGDNYFAESVIEDAATCGAILGIDLRTKAVTLMGGGTRMDPCIYFSGFWSQGDGACFEGSYQYAKGAAKKIRDHAPVDKELHRIADELQKIQKANFYGLCASVKHTGHYCHSRSMTVDVMNNDSGQLVAVEIAERVEELLVDFADWIYKQLKTEYEYQNSDEVVDDTIRANEYEFNEDGTIV